MPLEVALPEEGLHKMDSSPVAAPLAHGLSIVAQTPAWWEHDLAVQLAVSRPLLMWCWQ
ncbi:unnamed protein product [Rangifer tarandus platyrhynchus]|uniref:Uncharacterized protein n=1 Tax=Rangifer tarandus platyrhynchus TaxID=3082113 RepID=A0AC59ZUV0_RANTA